MGTGESQGPSRIVLVLSAVVLCVVLIGSAVFFRDDGATSTSRHTSPATSTVQPLFDRCDREPRSEVVEGLTRRSCTVQTRPRFLLFMDSAGDVIERAGLMVEMPRSPAQLEERKAVGLQLFSMIAGAPAESFLPPDVLGAIGSSETRFERDGLVYLTQPMGKLGLVFTVLHEDAPPEPQKAPH